MSNGMLQIKIVYATGLIKQSTRVSQKKKKRLLKNTINEVKKNEDSQMRKKNFITTNKFEIGGQFKKFKFLGKIRNF